MMTKAWHHKALSVVIDWQPIKEEIHGFKKLPSPIEPHTGQNEEGDYASHNMETCKEI